MGGSSRPPPPAGSTSTARRCARSRSSACGRGSPLGGPPQKPNKVLDAQGNFSAEGAGMSREGSDPGSRIAAVAAAVLLAGIAAPALVAFAHADPFIEPGYGASPNPVGQGQFTTLQAAVSCALPGCGPAYAEAYILPEMAAVFPGAGNHDDPAKNGLSMTPSDGLWNADTEFTSVVNDTAWLALGAHTVYLRGQGCGGFPTCWSEWATFTLTVDLPTTDTSAPAQSNPHYEPDNVISSGENSVTLVGTFDDTGDPGNATVGGAEYWFSGCGIPFIGGTPMSARDGAFDGATEDAVSLLDVTGWPDGTYVFFMRGWDSLGNDATSCISAELYIQRTPTDTLGPLASSGGVTPSSVIQGGGPVDVSATIDDSTTGNSNVGGAEYFVDPDPLTGIPNPPPYVSDTGVNMLPTDGFWDTPTEGASKWSVDVSAWLPGIYTLSIHGRDRWGYWGDIGVAGEHTTATLTVGSPVPLPPTGLRASVSGSDVLVTWTVPSPASGLDHYNVYRGASASVCPAGALVATVPSGTTLYTHTAAAADANPYIYNVRSANAAGQEDRKSVV